MRNHLLILILISVGLFLAGFDKALAQTGDSLLLSKRDTSLILDRLQAELTKQGTLNFPFLKPEEQVAIFLARDASRGAVFDFLPWFITTETIQTVIKVANFAKRIPELTVKDLFEELESKTVQEAVKFGTDWLFQNEIKVSSGEIQGSYLSYWGGQSQVKFQYLMTYAEDTQSSGDLIFEFYSADQIDPPAQSNLGFPWEIGDWLVKNKKKLDPFIVHVDARVMKSGLGWILDSSADTKITVEFPDTVPVLKLSKELPYPFEEQKIKLLNYLNTARRIFDFLQSVGSEALGKTADFAHKAQEKAKNILSYLSDLIVKNGGASLVDSLSSTVVVEFPQNDQTKLSLVTPKLSLVEDEQKFSLAKDTIENEGILNSAKDEAQPVENLVEPSFPQEQSILDSVKDSQPQVSNSIEPSFIKDNIEFSQAKEEILEKTKSDLVVEEEMKLSLIKDEAKLKECDTDPLQATALGYVVINEVAWMGTSQSANDEWIELHSKATAPVSLNGWRLRDKGNHINIVFDSSHALAPNGFFLLERTNDTTVPNFTADIIYTGALSNSDEALYLFDQHCVLRDKVAASPDWPGGDNTSKKSMERNNHNLEWYTYDGQGFGSPRQTNGRDMLADYRPLVNVSFQAGVTGGGPPLPLSVVTYPKVLISEIQIEGDGARDEFIELYNPNSVAVNLAGWKLMRKTSGGSDAHLVSASAFSGTIGSYGYFLIVPQLNEDGTPNYKGSAVSDLYYSGSTYSIAADNAVFLYNPNGELSDQVGFGAALYAEGTAAANPSAGNSLSRKYENGVYQDTDSNAQDFLMQSPSAKAVNPAPAPPPSPPPPADTTVPAAVTDLSASNPTTSTIQLTWTAPGDDGSTGTATSYDVRYSAAGITADNFNSATQVTGEPIPSTAGTSESMAISGLSAGATYYFALKSSDETANTSALSNTPNIVTTALPSPPQDTTSPQVTLDALTSSQGNTDFTLSWIVTDSGGEASASGVQSIFIEYTVTPSVAGVFAQYDSNGVWTSWQTGSAGKITLNSQATSLSIRGQDGSSYTFQVSASDVAGNISSVVNASTAVSLPKTVVINEIAWAGTKAQSTDEWLELFNTTGASVDLTGWRVASSDSSGPEITLTGSIVANGFYLTERTDDQATTATAQLTASFGNGLSNTACETLYLYNAEGVVVDQTACANDGAWPAGTASPDYISMERVVSTTEGSSVSNWASNNRIQYNNKDTGNNWINGTPGQANSTATSPTTITDTTLRFDEFSSLTLTTLGSPYVTTASVTIPATKTLIVEPGVTVKFKDNTARLTVQGTLKAQGTQAGGITFTTDGSTLWCGIKIASTSTDSQLDYVTIDKAQSTGSSFCNESVNYAMYVDSSAVAINNSVIQTGSYHRKLYLKNSSSIINASTISGATLNTESVGIYVDGGSPTISNSTVSNNSTGIFVNSLANSPTIQNNTFTGNTQAVKLSSASAALSENTATSNTYNGTLFEGAVLSNMTWQADTMPYIVNKFTVSTGTTLTIQAGAAVKFINTPSTESEITVQGTLITQGTQANLISFAGITDATTWKRIYIAPGSTGSQLSYTTITKGGNTYNEAVLYVKQSNIQLSNVTISNSAYSGIYSSSGTITGSDVTLSNNTYGFHIQTGDCPALSNVTVTGTLLHPSSTVCSF